MKGVELLEHGGQHLYLRVDGEIVETADPSGMHYQTVLACIMARHAPGTPAGIPLWKAEAVYERWSAAWDLLDFRSAQRLAYLVDHFRPQINADLAYLGMDLGQLWRQRRWRLLLDAIDRLPAHSWYASAVAMDPGHAKMVSEHLAAGPADEAEAPVGPSLNTWTPEVARLTSILDAVRRVEYAVVAVQAGKGKAPDPPKPEPRPKTALEIAMAKGQVEARKANYRSIVDRLLPHRDTDVKG